MQVIDQSPQLQLYCFLAGQLLVYTMQYVTARYEPKSVLGSPHITVHTPAWGIICAHGYSATLKAPDPMIAPPPALWLACSLHRLCLRT